MLSKIIITNGVVTLENFFLFVENIKGPNFSKNFLFDKTFLLSEKEKWSSELKKKPRSFFSNTSLLFLIEDFIVLLTLGEDHSIFLKRYYSLEEQNFCRDFFGEEKNILIISDDKLKRNDSSNFENVSFYVLLKNMKMIENNIHNYLTDLFHNS